MKKLDKNISSNLNSVIKSFFFQPKLTVNKSNDIYEKEANEMSDKVMRMPMNKDRNTFFSARSPSYRVKTTSSIQRKCTECEREEENQIQRKENSSETPSNSHIENYVSNLNGRGNYLSPQTRSFFEPRFGYNFSNVRVHNDSIAANSAQSINALAYTSGNNIVFNQNQYSPEMEGGKKLLAHELTHVVQQGKENNAMGTKMQSVKIQLQRQNIPSPCPARDNPQLRCPNNRIQVVHTAFQTAANWLANAQTLMNDYIRNPQDPGNRCIANALRRNLGWNERIRQQPHYPDVPQIILNRIQTIISNIGIAFNPSCLPQAQSGARGTHIIAETGGFWQNNCITFYNLFFDNNRVDPNRRAKVVLHELTHNWLGSLDSSYEGDSNFPGPVNSAYSNADSVACLIRDLGTLCLRR